MQFKSLAVVALSAGALAAPEKRQATDANLASIYQVLQTAVPTSIALEFLTNSAGVYSSVASELAVSSTPSWIAALPSDVQSYLIGVAQTPSAASSAIANATAAVANSTSAAAGGLITSAPVIVNGTTVVNGTSPAVIAGNGTALVNGTIPATISNGTAIINGTALANGTIVSATGVSTRSGSTTGGLSAPATRSGSGSGSSGSSGSSGASGAGASGSSATSTGGAAFPTAFGMGIAGAVGLVGVFVL
ncbi:hypothetical protein D6D19_00960 [Aureobasidium pullulans]|uniref:Uncharacterized protein n=1 Tax=Aureobasidium pullulans TaxID=5580 RepID=A0A4S9AJA7_AURPU|nr:hypothetical protein D6D19_00960 [Aureobasidium pullulans]THY31235.1 hypothetical protein D6D00_02411 [Aureobasidium pullulans]